MGSSQDVLATFLESRLGLFVIPFE
jgi:hypothetical protein